MPAASCWFCNKVKGKRVCPARGGALICSRCCGTKRRVEIHCPEECPYLHGEHDPRWESPALETALDEFASQFAGVTEKEADLSARVLLAVLRERAGLSGDLSDVEALEVVSTLARTFETLTKGILYEHALENLKLQAIVQRLSHALRDRASWLPESTDRDVLGALERLKAGLQAHVDRASSSKSYLDLAARLLRFGEVEPPGLGAAEPGESRLIVEP